jgi:predicted RNase H-like HicB family nuclease
VSEREHDVAYTAIYRKTSTGYLGQLVEWPQVVTEGKDLDDCRAMLKDALREMMAAYKNEGQEIPGPVLYESIDLAS